MREITRQLLEMYRRLVQHLGPQQWWPAETPFEVMVGAVLTQNTNWRNVERAIANVKARAPFTPHALYALPPAELASLIRPAGYFNIKTKRLRHFLEFFLTSYHGEVEQMRAQPLESLRAELLRVSGIGPETADSILLYALGKLTFVVDAYTHRILRRHYLSPVETTYDELQSLFHEHLPAEVVHFNEYHAVIVAAGKRWCRKTRPDCAHCPLRGLNWPAGMVVAAE